MLDSSLRPHETYLENAPINSSASNVYPAHPDHALTLSRPTNLPVNENPANRPVASGPLEYRSSAALSLRENTFRQYFSMFLNRRSHSLHRRWAGYQCGECSNKLCR
jgi:hypothetical protein